MKYYVTLYVRFQTTICIISPPPTPTPPLSFLPPPSLFFGPFLWPLPTGGDAILRLLRAITRSGVGSPDRQGASPASAAQCNSGSQRKSNRRGGKRKEEKSKWAAAPDGGLLEPARLENSGGCRRWRQLRGERKGGEVGEKKGEKNHTHTHTQKS